MRSAARAVAARLDDWRRPARPASTAASGFDAPGTSADASRTAMRAGDAPFCGGRWTPGAARGGVPAAPRDAPTSAAGAFAAPRDAPPAGLRASVANAGASAAAPAAFAAARGAPTPGPGAPVADSRVSRPAFVTAAGSTARSGAFAVVRGALSVGPGPSAAAGDSPAGASCGLRRRCRLGRDPAVSSSSPPAAARAAARSTFPGGGGASCPDAFLTGR